MIKIAGIWDYSWNIPILEMDQWVVIVREFEIDEFIMTPVSGIQNANLTGEKASLQDVLDEHADYTKVFVDEQGATNLKDFVHPSGNVLYLFGRTNYSPFTDLVQEGDLSVKITTPANLGMLLSHQSAGIVLLDRYNKWLLQ